MMDDREGVDIYIEPGLPKRGLNWTMRSTIVACAILVLLIGTADAARLGSAPHSWSIPTSIHVSAPCSTPKRCRLTIMSETLASECVKATFFMVGQMARAYPWMVRRVYDEGHTVANHTQNHPIRPAPLPKSRLISPIFTADSVSLHVSPEKDGKSGLVYARIGRCQGRPAWRGACAAVPRRYV